MIDVFPPEKRLNVIQTQVLLKAWELMNIALALTEIYEDNKTTTSKYVHATSRGHEAIQLALGLQLTMYDYVSPYYRDDSLLLGIGITPYELMLQLMAKRDDPFSGGRSYYSHPSLNRPDMPKIPMQSSATGMQAIPATGVAMGVQYKELQGLISEYNGSFPVVVCSLGDASVTEGEVSEALQMAVLKKLPIIYLVQDNEWDISASAAETRAQNAAEYARGFKGLDIRSIDGTDFITCYNTVKEVIELVRKERRPFLIHAKVPLLNHHTSGVRKEWYRDDLDKAILRDPIPRLKNQLLAAGVSTRDIDNIKIQAKKHVEEEYQKALNAEDPKPDDLYANVFAQTPVTEEKGQREPLGVEKRLMIDCALFAVRELMEKHPEALLYGQDVGLRLGGVFRESATLAQKFGNNRVFNTPIQEAFIIGSTVGMSVAGLKPIVEVQFADYIWPGLNQLFTEVSRSCYLSNGKWPISCVIRVPIGAYGSGGPYHSSSVESVLTNIRGIKICYPSTGADMKGLMKSAYYDPNPVIMLEHKGLYWSKIKGTEDAKTIEPDEEYIIPLGKARIVKSVEASVIHSTCTVITYGMGVYWAQTASKNFESRVEVLDLRTLYPLDEDAIFASVRKHSRCIVLTEEPTNNSFAQSISARIQQNCFNDLDAPVMTVGAENLPAIPLNSLLEQSMLPSADKVLAKLDELLAW